jgi:hypothetical protein
VRNPFADRHKVLGTTPAAFNQAKAQAEAVLRARDAEEQVDEALVRAALVPPVADRVWNEVKKDLGL